MLQIRLSKGGSSADTAAAAVGGGGGGAASGLGASLVKAAAVGPGAAEGVMVACPDHLVIADLPVAKSIGAVTASAISAARTIGRRSRRPLGERVHICSRCDFPIAIYGRLTPCEHAFCLTCARSDSSCYLCDDRIQKIQSVKMMEGIFICAAPHCLKSFLKKSDFEIHIHRAHANLLESHHVKEGAAESDAPKDATLKPESSTARGPARQLPMSPTSSSQINDPDSRNRAHFQRENNTLSKQKSFQSDQVITPEKMDSPFIYPPLPPHQPNFGMGMNMNQPMVPPQPFGNQQFFPNPYQIQMPDGGPDPGSLLGIPPSPWVMGLMGMPVQQQMQMGQGGMEGVDPSLGGLAFLQGMHGDNSGDNKNFLANLQMQLQMPMSIQPPQMPPASMQQHFNR